MSGDNLNNDEYDNNSLRSVSIRSESVDDESASEDENNSINEEINNFNRRGKNKEYELVKEYDNIADAMTDINKDFLKSNNLKKGTKNISSSKNCVQNYRCKVKGCPFCYRLIMNSNEESVKLEKNSSNHNHEGVVQSDWNLQKGILEKIFTQKLSEDTGKIKPKKILKEFQKKRDDNLLKSSISGDTLPDPAMQQIYNWVQRANSDLFKVGGKVTLADIEKYAIDHGKDTVPRNDLDTPFVLDHEIDLVSQRFRLGITTWRMLNNCNNFTGMVHSDTTHKVTWEGFPCFLFGRTDKNRTFHLAVVGICSNETQEDFGFIFKIWNDNVINMQPKYVLSDAAEAIFLGAKQVWCAIIRIMCFIHVLKVIIIIFIVINIIIIINL